jgi:hypothetical protein
VILKIFENEGGSEPVFARGFDLQGFNSDDDQGRFKFDGVIESSGYGEYFVEVMVPGAAEAGPQRDTTNIRLNGTGVDPYYKIVATLDLKGALEAYTAG